MTVMHSTYNQRLPKDARIVCPSCNNIPPGPKLCFAHNATCCMPEIRNDPCDFCGGLGHVSLEKAEAWVTGRKMREERLARNESLREAAKRMGIKPSELSAIEHGKIES